MLQNNWARAPATLRPQIEALGPRIVVLGSRARPQRRPRPLHKFLRNSGSSACLRNAFPELIFGRCACQAVCGSRVSQLKVSQPSLRGTRRRTGHGRILTLHATRLRHNAALRSPLPAPRAEPPDCTRRLGPGWAVRRRHALPEPAHDKHAPGLHLPPLPAG
jgi:hypothetical protein